MAGRRCAVKPISAPDRAGVLAGRYRAGVLDPDIIMLRKIYLLIISIVIALFILSLSIAVPISVRGLYYSQIDKLNLVEETGYSEETIRGAFDEMMDYCTKGGPNSGLEFGTGELKWSQSGKEHFDDVARLFSLDKGILAASAIGLLLFIAFEFFVKKPEEEGPREPAILALGRGPFFWGPAGLLAALALIGGYAALDFDKFFVTFHHVFFPGKDNWIFYEDLDEIIKILPQQVFSNFALVIGIAGLGLCVVSILIDFLLNKGKGRD